MLGKAKEALGDVADALRKLFTDPKVTTLTASEIPAQVQAGTLLEVRTQSLLEPPVATERVADLFQAGPTVGTLAPLEARLQSEQGWEAWGAESRALDCPLFGAGRGTQLDVPPLPKGARVMPLREPFRSPGVQRQDLQVDVGRPRSLEAGRAFEVGTRTDLDAAMLRPFIFEGEKLGELPKGLWMRYSLALVKATGENVRNLEVVGLYRLPRKGVGELKPDAQGRLWVQLSPEAVKAKRAAFMLARRKDDQAYLSAFVEDP